MKNHALGRNSPAAVANDKAMIRRAMVIFAELNRLGDKNEATKLATAM